MKCREIKLQWHMWRKISVLLLPLLFSRCCCHCVPNAGGPTYRPPTIQHPLPLPPVVWKHNR